MDDAEREKLIRDGERDLQGLNRMMADSLRRRGIKNPELVVALLNHSNAVSDAFVQDAMQVAGVVDEIIDGDPSPSDFQALADAVLSRL